MRIDYLDGLRGLAAIGVVYIHYCEFLYPIISKGFYTSCVMVCEFFVISGFVLSYRFWQNQNSEILTSSSLRRYIRLTPAPLVSILVTYVMIKFSLFHYVQVFQITGITEWMPAYANFVPSLTQALYESLWGMYFSFDPQTSYSPVLWTMQWELKGSLLVAAFLALFGKVQNRLPLYIIFIIISIDTLYPTFIFGVMFSDLLYSKEGKQLHESLKKQKLLAIIMLVSGAFLSLYAADSDVNFYKNLNFEFLAQHGINHEVFYHMIASVMIMYAAVNLQTLQKFLSWKPFIKVGEYSFSLYLIHAQVGMFLGGFIFLELFHHGYDITICRLVTIPISLLATVPATYLLHNFVDMPAGKLAKRMQKFFE